MALWDLLGKALGVPVYQLFGGKFRDSIRLYADGHAGTIDAEGHHVEESRRDPVAREREIRAELAQLRRMTSIPICAGENVYTRFGIFDLIKREAVDIVMPDLAKFGGLMDGIRVAGLAELNGLPFAPHNVSGPIGTVAMAHVCAAIPNFLILEFHGMDLDYWGDLVSYAAGDVIQQGAVPLSDAPGWGIELNDEVVRAHLHHRMVDDYFGEPL